MHLTDHSHLRNMSPRGSQAQNAIIHNTGSTHADEILKYYTSPKSLCPHYVITPDGTVHKIVPEDRVAYHVAYSAAVSKLYASGPDAWKLWRKRSGALEKTVEPSYYDSWQARWPGVSDPRVIPGARPNYMSNGIELVALRKPTERVFTDEQYVALCELLADMSPRMLQPFTRSSVFGHSDADPISRFNSKGSWDPGASFDWTAVYAALGI